MARIPRLTLRILALLAVVAAGWALYRWLIAPARAHLSDQRFAAARSQLQAALQAPALSDRIPQLQQTLQQAVQLNPANLQARAALANLQVLGGAPQQALPQLAAVAGAGGQDPGAAAYAQAMQQLISGQPASGGQP